MDKFKLEISFIIPCFNSANTIGKTLQSIVDQDGYCENKSEIIVVDNNSSDELDQKLIGFTLTKVNCLVQGASSARNKGAKVSNGRIIAFIDSDVILEKLWMKHTLLCFEEADIDGCSSQIIPAGNQTRFSKFRYRYKDENLRGTFNSLDRMMLNYPFINTAACAYLASSFNAIGGFDTSLGYGEDLDFSNKLSYMGIILDFNQNAKCKVLYQGGTVNYLKRAFKKGFYVKTFYLLHTQILHFKADNVNYFRGFLRKVFNDIFFLIKTRDIFYLYRLLIRISDCLGRLAGVFFAPYPENWSFESALNRFRQNNKHRKRFISPFYTLTIRGNLLLVYSRRLQKNWAFPISYLEVVKRYLKDELRADDIKKISDLKRIGAIV